MRMYDTVPAPELRALLVFSVHASGCALDIMSVEVPDKCLLKLQSL